MSAEFLSEPLPKLRTLSGMPDFHSDLAQRARWIPALPTSPTAIRVLSWLSRQQPPIGFRQGVPCTKQSIEGSPPTNVHVYRPKGHSAAALLWMHGGGYVLGHPHQDISLNSHFAKELGMVVVAVQYRLAPEHPFPCGIEDCYAALQWMHREAATLGIDPNRIAIGGASAGAGLAAALAQLARSRDGAKPCFQLLLYPMLDDRTALRNDLDETNFRLWTQAQNRYAWRAYTGQEPGAPSITPHAAPARCTSFAGLPPAWIGVGTLDLFHDECISYAQRLNAAGVACELNVVEGGYHAFDIADAAANVSKQFRAAQMQALRSALRL